MCRFLSLAFCPLSMLAIFFALHYADKSLFSYPSGSWKIKRCFFIFSLFRISVNSQNLSCELAICPDHVCFLNDTELISDQDLRHQWTRDTEKPQERLLPLPSHLYLIAHLLWHVCDWLSPIKAEFRLLSRQTQLSQLRTLSMQL